VYEEEERRSETGLDRIFIGQCEITLVQGPETDKRDSSGGIRRPSCICGRGIVICVEFQDRGTEIRSTGFNRTFQTSGIYVGGGVFILAYFYRRRSRIVKAGAAVGGV
jgi:hypothetical protein